MKNLLAFRSTVFQLTACLIIFTSCSKEELEISEIDTPVQSNLITTKSEAVTSTFGDNKLEIFNILPGTTEYKEQLEIFRNEGVRVNADVNAIKVVDQSQNTTYYFKSKSRKTFGIFYMEGKFTGVLSVEEGLNLEGKPSLVLSNLKGDRKVDLRDRKDVAEAFPGERTLYSDCVSDSVMYAFDGCGGGFFGYVCAVPWSMGSVVYCVGEAAFCYFFCD